MSAQHTVYLNLREITEVHKPDIQVRMWRKFTAVTRMCKTAVPA